MERGRMCSVPAALLLLTMVAPLTASPLELAILTTWSGSPVQHIPVTVTLDSPANSDDLLILVQAPYYRDPPPPAEDNTSYIGLWDYEVVEVFFLNDANQYLQIEVSPRGQYFALLFDGERNYKRFSLPLLVTAAVHTSSWTATVTVPAAYLPYKVSKFNAYSTHGAPPHREYEAYSPAPASARGPDYHDLSSFAAIDLDPVIPGLSSRPMSQLWVDALAGRIRYTMDTLWDGSPTGHAPTKILLEGDRQQLIVNIDAPFFDNPIPFSGKPGQAYPDLYKYEVVEVFFLNNEHQYLEVEVGPYGHHWVLLLWTKNGTYNRLRHSLPLDVTTSIAGDRWTAQARIPLHYLPPKVSRFNAFAQHTTVGGERHEESLYPQHPDDGGPDFHALDYFRPIDLNSIVPGQSDLPMSELWENTVQGIFKYSIKTEWNGVPIDHQPTVFSLEGFEAGVELNVSAAFFNDPAPRGAPGHPQYGLWDYEVVEMFFLNDNGEYLEVELGPWGQHLLLLLKGQRKSIKHSLPLDYVVTARQLGRDGQPGTWQGSALIPPEYFPPNVSSMNAYAIHGTGGARTYEALYPATQDGAKYPQPDFHRLELFQEMDFNFLVVDNTRYSQVWVDAITNSTAAAAADDAAVDTAADTAAASATDAADTAADVETGSVLKEDDKVYLKINELSGFDTTTKFNEQHLTSAAYETPSTPTVGPLEDTTSDIRADSVINDALITTERIFVDTTVPNVAANTVETVDIDTATDVAVDDRKESITGITDKSQIQEPVTDLNQFNNENLEHGIKSNDKHLQLSVAEELTTIESENAITTISPEGTTNVREPDIPQPELVKEARRQDIKKPSGNLFRPVPIRAPPRTPFPTKLDETSDLGPSVTPDVGVLQEPSFARPLFPPPSFFNHQSTFGAPEFFTGGLPPPSAFINGRPVAIQGQTQFPLPPQIKLKNQFHATPGHFLPPQPHLDHLFQHVLQHHQQDQNQQQTKVPLHADKFGLPPLPIVDHQTNEIIPINEQQGTVSESIVPSEGPTQLKPQGQGVGIVKPEEKKTPVNQMEEPVQEGVISPTKLVFVPSPIQSAIAFSKYPPRHDLCSKQGLIADPFRCPIFHECILENNEWQVYTWRCPRGKFFDQSSLSCRKGFC